MAEVDELLATAGVSLPPSPGVSFTAEEGNGNMTPVAAAIAAAAAAAAAATDAPDAAADNDVPSQMGADSSSTACGPFHPDTCVQLVPLLVLCSQLCGVFSLCSLHVCVL